LVLAAKKIITAKRSEAKLLRASLLAILLGSNSKIQFWTRFIRNCCYYYISERFGRYSAPLLFKVVSRSIAGEVFLPTLNELLMSDADLRDCSTAGRIKKFPLLLKKIGTAQYHGKSLLYITIAWLIMADMYASTNLSVLESFFLSLFVDLCSTGIKRCFVQMVH
jgi:hypothetical protein